MQKSGYLCSPGTAVLTPKRRRHQSIIGGRRFLSRHAKEAVEVDSLCFVALHVPSLLPPQVPQRLTERTC